MNDRPDQTRERLLREQSLAFFGAITASVSHELNNVISILDQSAGLLGDLAAGSRQGRPLPVEKIEKVSVTMQHQTQRGLGIIRRLNRFAHSVDLPDCQFDLAEAVGSLGTLCIRLADMKSTTVSLPPPPAPTIVTGSPFLLQQWLFLIFRRMLAVAQKGDTIEMRVAADSSGPSVRIRGPHPTDLPTETDLATEQLLCAFLGGESEQESEGASLIVRLTLPKKEGDGREIEKK